MFEKHFGRKVNPPVEIKSEELLEGIKKPWLEHVADNQELMEWFSGSVVCDEYGNPLPVFHSTRDSGNFASGYAAEEASELGAHFGTAEAANSRLKDTFDAYISANSSNDIYEWFRQHWLTSGLPEDEIQEELRRLDLEYAEKEKILEERMATGILGGEKIFPVLLRIINPVRVSDPGSFSEDRLVRIKKDLIRNFATRDQVSKIQMVRTIEELRKCLIELGYDGVVYKNNVEGPGADSYIPIVGPEQIRSVFSDQESKQF